jgi:glycosyltransferase involved in cell wall biosynthesis
MIVLPKSGSRIWCRDTVRILVVSNLYPPVAFGGYEVECSAVVDRLRANHEVMVLTSSLNSTQAPHEPHVERSLRLLTPDMRGALRAPIAAYSAVHVARRALEFRPDLVYVWNASGIPHAALRVIADAGAPMAVRVCELWFGRLFVGDQFMRELLPAKRSLGRTAWAGMCRVVNRLPTMGLDPLIPVKLALSWNSQTVRRLVGQQQVVSPVLERVVHSVPRYGDVYSDVVRNQAPDNEIVFVGRITPAKGVQVAVEALALLKRDHGISAQLTVIGPEENHHGTELREIAARIGVAEAIKWVGPAKPAEIADVLARASALIMPSICDEAFPLVMIEGALARVPLIGADVGGTSEGMHDEEHALLFPRGSAQAAATALARTLREDSATAARVERAHIRAQDFRLEPYLDEQERFVHDAYAGLSSVEQDHLQHENV